MSTRTDTTTEQSLYQQLRAHLADLKLHTCLLYTSRCV